jgi:proton-coupled amino acid transporter
VVFISLLVNYGMRLVVAVRVEVNKTRETPLSSYEEVSRAVAGRWGHVATVAAMLLTQLGIGSAYVLFVATQMHSFPGLDVLSIQLWAVTVSPLFVALCLIRNMSHLAPFSAFGIVAVAFALVCVLFYGFSVPGVHFPQMRLLPHNYFLFFGMAVFAFEGINLAIPVHSNMERPESYGAMLNVSFLVIGVVYSVFALLAYSFFLDDTQNIIVQNLPNTWIVIVVKVCITINVLLTFPVQLVPAVLYFERLVFRSEEHVCTSPRFANFWKRNLLRLLLVAAVVGLAVAVPFFEVVVSLVGGLGNGTAGFVLPAILHLILFRGRAPMWKVALNWVVLVFGAATTVLVTVFSVMRMVEEFQHAV